ncbi:MAG TPA: shikimate kinase [Treponemataceae bacterium]|nr:shikimate kinase [Treponemataceae bacterium]
MKNRRAIVIMGMKHTGKSTVGALLASRLGVPFHDTDAVIAELSGKTARELYDSGGAALMKERETEAARYLAERCAETRSGCVIATGGGLADNPDAIAILKETGVLVYLDTPFKVLFARVMESARRDGRLPRFLEGGDPEALFRELFLRRSKTYATITDVRIDTGVRPPSEIVREIMDRTAE